MPEIKNENILDNEKVGQKRPSKEELTRKLINSSGESESEEEVSKDLIPDSKKKESGNISKKRNNKRKNKNRKK